MKTLIRLELRRTNFRTYVISALIIAVIMLGFLYPTFRICPYVRDK